MTLFEELKKKIEFHVDPGIRNDSVVQALLDLCEALVNQVKAHAKPPEREKKSKRK